MGAVVALAVTAAPDVVMVVTMVAAMAVPEDMAMAVAVRASCELCVACCRMVPRTATARSHAAGWRMSGACAARVGG